MRSDARGLLAAAASGTTRPSASAAAWWFSRRVSRRVSILNFQQWERVMNPMEIDHEVLTVREICVKMTISKMRFRRHCSFLKLFDSTKVAGIKRLAA
jgi:hypothetical protein